MDMDALKEKLEPLFKDHEIQKAILFGSCARNEASRYSDIDLILVKDTKLRFLGCYEGVLSSFSQAWLDLTPGQVYISQDSAKAIEKARTYLKNGKLRSKSLLGADRWISKTNNGQSLNLYFQKWNVERMAKDARE